MSEQQTLFDAPEDWCKHWEGMPEFIQPKKEPYSQIILRFRNKEDLDEFSSIIGQRLTRLSKSTWHPALSKDESLTSGKKYVYEP